MEATRTKKTTFVCQFCNAIVATTSGSKDAFEKHMEDSHNILTNLNVVMALHTMTKEEKEKLMRTKRKELEQEFGVKVKIGDFFFDPKASSLLLKQGTWGVTQR